jgi:Serine/Threonine/Tyrosine Kinase found in polyvalent proteins
MANATHGSLAADAAAHLAKSANSVESLSGSPKEIRRQAGCLVEWARTRNVLLADDHAAGLERREEETSEHEVFLRASDNRVVKCTYPGCFGYVSGPNGRTRAATPLFYLYRLELMNQVFGDDLRLEGVAFGKPRFGDEEEKRPYIVVSQAWIDSADENSPHPSEKEIEDFMESLGFKRLEDSCYRWHREFDGVTVSDTKVDNFIKSHKGVVPIDLLIIKR